MEGAGFGFILLMRLTARSYIKRARFEGLPLSIISRSYLCDLSHRQTARKATNPKIPARIYGAPGIYTAESALEA